MEDRRSPLSPASGGGSGWAGGGSWEVRESSGALTETSCPPQVGAACDPEPAQRTRDTALHARLGAGEVLDPRSGSLFPAQMTAPGGRGSGP